MIVETFLDEQPITVRAEYDCQSNPSPACAGGKVSMPGRKDKEDEDSRDACVQYFRLRCFAVAYEEQTKRKVDNLEYS